MLLTKYTHGCGLDNAGEVELDAEAAPWWLLQRCLLLEQLDALDTFMALVDRSAHNMKPSLQGWGQRQRGGGAGQGQGAGGRGRGRGRGRGQGAGAGAGAEGWQGRGRGRGNLLLAAQLCVATDMLFACMVAAVMDL